MRAMRSMWAGRGWHRIAWEVTAVLLLALVALATRAALPPLGPEALAANAKLVVTGTVLSVTDFTVRAPEGSDRVHVLDVAVGAVEAGAGAQAGETIQVRCWTIETRPAGWAGPAGHAPIPGKGTRVRLWLVPQGRRWTPLEPNGIEVLEAGAAPRESETPGP